jgi:hypothetical protein
MSIVHSSLLYLQTGRSGRMLVEETPATADEKPGKAKGSYVTPKYSRIECCYLEKLRDPAPPVIPPPVTKPKGNFDARSTKADFCISIARQDPNPHWRDLFQCDASRNRESARTTGWAHQARARDATETSDTI